MTPSDDPAAGATRHRRRARAPRPVRQDPPGEQPGERPGEQPTAPPRAERGLRNLVGAGSSQLGVSGALRGRDVNRPTDEDLAEAERDVVIVRRNWKPPA
ncbi:MAG TPA: hypothetical protein VFT67_15905 [Jatrophihabitantaceae bacterium]|nr:hypothetical protein [Jatrophihabitantaceae bacterium]